jgi:hypothetical protein
MILLIRGHIRTGFDTPYLYNFVKTVYELYKVKIYIQTWSVFSNSISWRPIANNPTKVTEEVIKNYFKDIPINDILILDDTKITLHGIKSGNVGISCVPMIGWKNMWYGKSALADYVAAHEAPDSILINTRFDCVFEYANIEDLLLFIKNQVRKSRKILFSEIIKQRVESIIST